MFRELDMVKAIPVVVLAVYSSFLLPILFVELIDELWAIPFALILCATPIATVAYLTEKGYLDK